MRTPHLCGMEANLDFNTSHPLFFKREWKKTEAGSLETKDFYFRAGNIFSSERKGAEQCQELLDTGEMGFTEGAQPQAPSAFSSPGEGPVARCQCWGPGAPPPPACEPERAKGGDRKEFLPAPVWEQSLLSARILALGVCGKAVAQCQVLLQSWSCTNLAARYKIRHGWCVVGKCRGSHSLCSFSLEVLPLRATQLKQCASILSQDAIQVTSQKLPRQRKGVFLHILFPVPPFKMSASSFS